MATAGTEECCLVYVLDGRKHGLGRLQASPKYHLHLILTEMMPYSKVNSPFDKGQYTPLDG